MSGIVEKLGFSVQTGTYHRLDKEKLTERNNQPFENFDSQCNR